MPSTLELKGVMVTSYFDFTYKPILDKEGKIYCILHTAVDVSERVAALNLVREKELKEKHISNDLQAVNEQLLALIEEFQTSNEKLAVLNEKYTVTNEHLDDAGNFSSTDHPVSD